VDGRTARRPERPRSGAAWRFLSWTASQRIHSHPTLIHSFEAVIHSAAPAPVLAAHRGIAKASYSLLARTAVRVAHGEVPKEP